ncbi:MAG: histone H1 [Acidobacteria bacterium]|nr:histone H1 [Acidobacteriota bacterium]
MATKPKRPRDTNQLAHMIAQLATGELDDVKTDDGKDPAAVALGRKGGLKGGKARAEKLTAKQRSDIAKKAAKNRWGRVP